MTQNKKNKKLTTNEKPLSRVSPVQYSPRRQSRYKQALTATQYGNISEVQNTLCGTE